MFGGENNLVGIEIYLAIHPLEESSSISFPPPPHPPIPPAIKFSLVAMK